MSTETAAPDTATTDVSPSRSPAQQEVLDLLGARPHERPEFDPRLRHALREELDDRLSAAVAGLPDDETLWVSKHLLASVHGCEGQFVANDAEEFAWSPPLARGSVAHKAIELSMSWRGDPAPGLLVEEAIARLIAGDDRLGTYLGGLGEAERAEVVGQAVERTAKFLESFPPLEPRWRPVPESSMRAELHEGRIVLAGKVDLTVGRADGLRAGKVLVDLKTGGFAPSHRDDLRFYALIETMRLGVPPRLLATHYLDSGRIQSEPVTEALLATAVERTVQGVEAAVALRHGGRTPTLRPGPPCRWCPRRTSCEEGVAWLQQRDEEDGW